MEEAVPGDKQSVASPRQPVEHDSNGVNQAKPADDVEEKEKTEIHESEEIDSENQNSEESIDELAEEEIQDIEEEEVEPEMIAEEAKSETDEDEHALDIEEDNQDSHPEKSTSQILDQAISEDVSERLTSKEHIQSIDQAEEYKPPSQLKEQSEQKLSEERSKITLTDLQQDNVFEEEQEAAKSDDEAEGEVNHELGDIQLGKKDKGPLHVAKAPEPKIFKIKTRTYHHDCSKYGLQCPDFGLLQALFERISVLRLLDNSEPTMISKDLSAQIAELKQVIGQLIAVDKLGALYTSELLYITRSILGFNDNRANHAFLCLVASMLQNNGLESSAVDELVHILTISSFFDNAKNPMQNILDFEQQHFAKALAASYAKEHTEHKTHSKFELIRKLLSHPKNLTAIIAYCDSLPKNELASERHLALFEGINDVVILSDLDYGFLKRLIRISLTPNARLRYKGLQLIVDYLQSKEVDSVVSHDDFKSLAICLFVNKVYHTANKSLDPEEFVKGLWTFVGKSQIRDLLFDFPEDFLTEYARLMQESTEFFEQTKSHLSQIEVEDVHDFQVSLLIAVTEIHRTSLSEDTLPQSLPITLGLLNQLFDTSNPKIELSRLVKFLNQILTNFQKPNLPDLALECLGMLPRLIQARIGLLLQPECIAQFEATVNILQKPIFTGIRQKIDFCGLLHNLSETDQNLLTLILYENMSEDDDTRDQIESRVLQIAESLIDPAVINSPVFASIKRLTNAEKFKRLAVRVIIANLDEVISNLETDTDKVADLANWCREPLLAAIEPRPSDEDSRDKEDSSTKIRTLLTNFNQC